MDESPFETAIARWLAGGVTSREHPVLSDVLSRHFHPLGIDADWLEAEPFGDLEGGGGGWWLRRPRWDPGRFDPKHPAAADFAPFLADPDRFQIKVGDQGLLEISASRPGTAAESWLKADEVGWNAVRHSLSAAAAAEAFIYAAAAALLASETAARLYAEERIPEFCQAIANELRKAEAAVE